MDSVATTPAPSCLSESASASFTEAEIVLLQLHQRQQPLPDPGHLPGHLLVTGLKVQRRLQLPLRLANLQARHLRKPEEGRAGV